MISSLHKPGIATYTLDRQIPRLFLTGAILRTILVDRCQASADRLSPLVTYSSQDSQTACFSRQYVSRRQVHSTFSILAASCSHVIDAISAYWLCALCSECTWAIGHALLVYTRLTLPSVSSIIAAGAISAFLLRASHSGFH